VCILHASPLTPLTKLSNSFQVSIPIGIAPRFKVCSDATNPSAVICHPGRANIPRLLLYPSSLASLPPMLGECRWSPLHASSASHVSPSLPWPASAGTHSGSNQQLATAAWGSPSSLHQRYASVHATRALGLNHDTMQPDLPRASICPQNRFSNRCELHKKTWIWCP
jgi:hypothetical protein